jgi:UDP-N-acetylmuramoyl-L-alanyl-D-glutamate--2,6-diaminopimelate ligase
VIARGLESVRSLPGRMERIMCGQEFAVLVDAANSPETLRNSLRAARQTTTGRLICVFGTAADGDIKELPAVGRVIGSFADVAAITHGRPTEFGSHRNILEVRSGFVDTSKVEVILDRQAAIQWALAEARAGDTVLIAGMGAEPHTPLGSDGELVNDGAIVRDALRGLPVGRPLG